MAVTTDLYKGKLYNDGEGLTHGDLNDARAWALAQALDQTFAHLLGQLQTGLKDPDMIGENGGEPAGNMLGVIYTMTGGEAILWADVGGGVTDVKITGGTIFQKLAAANGNEAQFLAHTIRDNEHTLAIAAGDATNPRIDIVQVKLEYVNGGSESRDFKDAITGALSSTNVNKTRRVQATISIKQGTPAATPTYPAPDAGYALLGAVRVPATWAGGFTPDGTGSASAGLRQCSVPLRIQAITQSMDEGVQVLSASNWSKVDAGVTASGGAGTDLIVWCPHASHAKRIVGVAITARWVTSGAVELRRTPQALTGPNGGATPVNDLSSVLVNADGTLRTYFAHLGHIADSSSDSNPSAANGHIGDAFWACGGKAGPTTRPFQLNIPPTTGFLGNRSALWIDGGQNSTIYEVTWYLAG